MLPRRTVAALLALGVVAIVVSASVSAGAVPGTPRQDGDAGQRSVDVDEPPASGLSTSGPNGTASLQVTQELALTPDRPGQITTTVTLTVPSEATSLTLDVPPEATVTESNGFDAVEVETGQFEWTGETTRPSLTLSVPANESVSDARSVGPYSFVDAGSWAVVATPQVSVDWTAGDRRTAVTREYTTAGEGVASESMTYLGPHETHTRQVAGQRIVLVEPRAASMRAEPAAVLDSLASAARLLSVGDRDERVVAIAAPTTVQWRAGGLTANYRAGGTRAIGDAFWVRDDSRLDTPRNVWVHEYVHTRQSFRYEETAAWTIEASAQYYALLSTLAAGDVDFGQFHAELARAVTGNRGDAVLVNPYTWRADTEYSKGLIVAAALDRRIRLASGGERSLAAVFRRLNDHDGVVTSETVEAAVAAAGNRSVAEAAERYTTTTDTPPAWDRDAHAAAFDGRSGGLDVRTNRTAVAVSGPYRTATLAGPSLSLVPGEKVTVSVTVENLAEEPRSFVIPLTADDRVVDTLTGRLDGRESRTLSTAYTVRDTGTLTLSIHGDSLSVTATRPGGVWVAALRANRTRLDPGGTVALTATVRNDGDETQTSTLSFARRFEPVGDRTVTLDPGENTTVTVTETLSTAGTYNYSLRGLGPVTVTVGSSGTEADGNGASDGDHDTASGSTGDAVATPGGPNDEGVGPAELVGPAVGIGLLAAVLVGVVLLGRRRREG